ncbi:MAG: DUF3427 domain-containing protein [Pseudomonadota bacterium]
MKNEIKPGLYEKLVTKRLLDLLDELTDSFFGEQSSLRDAEAADRLSWHVAKLVAQAIDGLPERDRASRGAEIANELISLVQKLQPKIERGEELIDVPPKYLEGVFELRPDGSPNRIPAPQIPLVDTTLLSNAPGEPRVGNQIKSEIASADSISILMAFVRMSGLRPLKQALVDHCAKGKSLRVVTTTYTKSTEPAALEWLEEIGAQVRVSYDTGTTRLHAKAWLFERNSGFSTAYIGSSNLTYSAQVEGLEWNVRLSEARNSDVLDKTSALFESTWESAEFEPFHADKFRQAVAPNRPTTSHRLLLSPFEFKPKPFQNRLLEQIHLARERGKHRNLLVSATGTGKTVMAAIDYSRLKESIPRDRLLFVAHRQEILEQSLSTFCHGLRDQNFGELWVGSHRPERFDHVFASIQTLNNVDLSKIDSDHFDVVIVDEFHHAAAKSYERILNHLQPRELLGLTATPERADGLPILKWFGGEIAAELRLWDAIDQHQLSPFIYYGVHDGYDLKEVPWKRGVGYDVDGLTNVYTANDRLANGLIRSVQDRVDEIGEMRALGFCVSVDHARYLARVFNEANVPAAAVWGESSSQDRSGALAALKRKDINVLFSVDLFNEGVDLPDVDTLLMLRPTNSATLFLQQLGRGLRKSENKRACTVLDFVGLHRKEYRFDIKYRALLGGSRKDVEQQVEKDFPFLPAGCHMELDKVSQTQVLQSLRNAIPTRKDAKVRELVSLTAGGRDISLKEFLFETGLEIEDVYTATHSWMSLRKDAGLSVAAPGPLEQSFQKALGRYLHIDDEDRIDCLRKISNANLPIPTDLSCKEARLIRMVAASFLSPKNIDAEITLTQAIHELQKHPRTLEELHQISEVLHDQIDHEQFALRSHPEIPLKIHARYSRIEIQSALGDSRHQVIPSAWREGVKWFADENIDAFAFTLDKTTGGFSPSTRYRDYAISPDLIHWESQSTTSASSKTGRRYQEHLASGSHIFLFARIRNSDRAFWFLGPATYVQHRSSNPMQVTWRLQYPLSGDLFAQFRAAV